MKFEWKVTWFTFIYIFLVPPLDCLFVQIMRMICIELVSGRELFFFAKISKITHEIYEFLRQIKGRAKMKVEMFVWMSTEA